MAGLPLSMACVRTIQLRSWLQSHYFEQSSPMFPQIAHWPPHGIQPMNSYIKCPKTYKQIILADAQATNHQFKLPDPVTIVLADVHLCRR